LNDTNHSPKWTLFWVCVFIAIRIVTKIVTGE